MKITTLTYISLAYLKQKVKQYLENYNDNSIAKPYQCKHCKKPCSYWNCNYFAKGIISLDVIKEVSYQIRRYLDDYNNNRISKPIRCKHCKSTCSLVWHCNYFRKNVVTLAGIYSHFPIKCVRCKSCGKIFNVLPEFLIKYYRFSKDVIKYALNKLKKITYEKVAGIIGYIFGIDIAINTLKYWVMHLRL